MSTASPHPARRWWLGALGPVGFALAAVVAGIVVDADAPAADPGVRSGYSHVHQFVSELAERGSPARPVMTAGFLVLGSCIAAFAGPLRASRWVATPLALVVAASGVATVAAGTFSCDPGCPTTGSRSISQHIHDVASVSAFLLWIAASLLTGWRWRATSYGQAALALGAIQVAAAGVLGVAFADRQVDDAVGLVQRTSLAAAGAWFVLTAVAVRSAPSATPGRQHVR